MLITLSPTAPLLEVPSGPKVLFEVESYDYPVMFPNIELHGEVLKSPLEDEHQEAVPRNILPRLQELINTDPLYRPSDEEKVKELFIINGNNSRKCFAANVVAIPLVVQDSAQGRRKVLVVGALG